MRLYCPICDKLTTHQQAHKNSKSGLLCGCGRFQPVSKINGEEMARRTRNNNPVNLPNNTPIGSPSVAPSQIISSNYTTVNHGLSLPNYNVNELLPTDLFSDSSSLPRTTKANADSLVQSIEEKRQTLRVVSANISLARDVVGAGTEYQRLQGDAITYGTELVNNQAKEVKYQTAGVNLNIEQSRLSQTQERLTQQGVALEGIQELTPLIREEWTQRVELQKSKVESIKLAVTSANAKLEADLRKLESSIESNTL